MIKMVISRKDVIIKMTIYKENEIKCNYKNDKREGESIEYYESGEING